VAADDRLVALVQRAPRLVVRGGDLRHRVALGDRVVARGSGVGRGRGGGRLPGGGGLSGSRGGSRRGGQGHGGGRRGAVRELLAAGRPGADALTGEHLLGDLDLLGGGRQVGP